MSQTCQLKIFLLRTLFSILALALIFPVLLSAKPPVDYDIVYVRAARAGDTERIPLPEVKDPTQMAPGAQT